MLIDGHHRRRREREARLLMDHHRRTNGGDVYVCGGIGGGVDEPAKINAGEKDSLPKYYLAAGLVSGIPSSLS
jgi:hypothetical protein